MPKLFQVTWTEISTLSARVLADCAEDAEFLALEAPDIHVVIEDLCHFHIEEVKDNE